jgi:hypothetical protein
MGRDRDTARQPSNTLSVSWLIEMLAIAIHSVGLT